MRLNCYEAWLEHVSHADTNYYLRNDWHSKIGSLAEDAKKSRSTV